MRDPGDVDRDRRAGDGWTVLEVVSDDLAHHARSADLRMAVHDEIVRRGGSITDRDTATHGGFDAVIGWGMGDEAVHLSADSIEVAALVLVGCDLSPTSIELISECTRTAVYTVADPCDRMSLAACVEGHLAAQHQASDIEIAAFDPSLASPVAAWIEERVKSRAHVDEVTITTADGWELGADLVLPANAATDGSLPAVVLMHSGRSDRNVFDGLAPELAQRGVAVLALDWRGRGVSTNLGHFVDFTGEQQAAVAGDVTASYDYLAARPEIDGNRLGVLGVAHGAGYGANGALGDGRTRALAMMTAYHLLEGGQEEVLRAGDVAVLCVACAPNKKSSGALRVIRAMSTHPGSRMMEFAEGVLGYQLFDLHPELEPSIAEWFAEVLGP